MPPTEDQAETQAAATEDAGGAAGTLVDVPDDHTNVEPTGPEKPDDNTALELALDAALKADEEAMREIANSERLVTAANAALAEAQSLATATIDQADRQAKDARSKAESLWTEFYGRMKERARRSPVRGGPLINWLNLVLVAVGLTLFVGCGPSAAEITNLRLDVRQNEQRLLDVERLDGKIAKQAVDELRISLDKQAAQLEALVEAVEQQTIISPCPCDHGVVSPPLILPMPEDLPPPPAKRVKARPKEECSPP